MKIAHVIFALLLAAVLAAPTSDALAQSSSRSQEVETPVLLQSSALIEGQYILLGDLFSGLDPELAQTPVAHAPQPGKQAVLDYRWLYGIAQRNNLNWRPRSTADQVLVTRASQSISIDEVADAIHGALEKYGVQSPFSVDMMGEALQIYLPVDVPPDIEITGLEVNQRTNRFIANVTTGGPTSQRRTFRMSGRFFPLSQIAVVVEPVRRGEVIRPDQVEYRNIPTERLPAGVVRDINDLIGKEVLRPVQANEPLLYRDFSNPILVRRGALVTIRLVTANMSLTARGKAMEDGAKGDVIRVLNQSSNKTIQVEVVAENEVRAIPAITQ